MLSEVAESFSFTKEITTYTPANFNGVVFTCTLFQKIAHISNLCDFHYISEGIPSLMHFWLLMTKVLWIWFMQIFARPKKIH